MDKIKTLMQKCGVRPELADRLCEGIENYLAQQRSKLLAEHKQRQEEAKRVCLEEVETYKRDLARRMQVFCEAKGGQIEQSIARQTAIRESAAQSKLRDILSLLEGVEPNGEPNGALQAENAKLKKLVQRLQAESKLAVERSNRNSALAAKVLKNNRYLEKQLREGRRSGEPAISEGRSGRRPTQRLDQDRQRRQPGGPVTTRATLKENQERRPQQPTAPQPGSTDFTPEGIAATMEVDLV